MDNTNNTTEAVKPIEEMTMKEGAELLDNASLSRLPILTISEEDKVNFFKSFISDKPYEEEFGFFNNTFKVSFRSLLVEETTDIIKQVNLDRDNNIGQNDDGYVIQIQAYRLGAALKNINGLPYLPEVTKANTPIEAGETYIIKRARPLLAWNEFKLSTVLDRFKQFERKLIELMSKIDDENFWKAAV